MCSLVATGNTHDSPLFLTTALWRHITNGNAIAAKVRIVNGVEIPPMILGDGAFPLRSWLAKPYEDVVLSDKKGISTTD